MKKFLVVYTLLLLAVVSNAQAYDPWDGYLNDKPLVAFASDGPLFVSLGSTCEPAHEIRGLNLRKAAFPFDWMVSADHDQLINMINDDLKHFCDENYLEASMVKKVILLNTYYSIVFPHEGKWDPASFEASYVKFKEKYERRIQRFKEISNFPGKVFFIRAARPYADSDQTIFKDKRNVEISDETARELYQALKNKFPNLDLTLIVLNVTDGTEVVLNHIEEGIVKMHQNPNIATKPRLDLCKRNFIKLMEDFGYTDAPIFQDLLNSLNGQ